MAEFFKGARRICFPGTPTYHTLLPADQMVVWYASRIIFVAIFCAIGLPVLIRLGPERAVYYLLPIALLLVFLGYQRLMELTARTWRGIRKKRYPKQ